MVFFFLNVEVMIFKYRGIIICFFSIKLFILVMVGIGVVIVVLMLYEIIVFDLFGNIDFFFYNNGFYLNWLQINVFVIILIENVIKIEVRNENININVL